MAVRKRFIAGAVCPACQAQDTLAMWREDDVDVVECVKCKHRMGKREDGVQHSLSGEQVSGGAVSNKQIAKGQVIGLFDPD